LFVDLVKEYEKREPKITPPIVNGYESIIGTDPTIMIPLHSLFPEFTKQSYSGMSI
jgi:hypothetical protein